MRQTMSIDTDTPPILSYALPTTNRQRDTPARLPKQSRWGELAAWIAGATLVCCVMCCVRIEMGGNQTIWAQNAWAADWIGGGYGILFAIVGCLQPTHRRSLAAHALYCNAILLVLSLPFIALNIPNC